MTIVTLCFNEKRIKDFALVREEQLTIGRNPDNDIIIDNMAVSGNHAVIESVGTNFVLRDLESTNGIFVNQKKTNMHKLEHNDVISIGKHELIFDRLVFDRDARVNKSQTEDESYFDYKTRFLDTKGYKELIQNEMNGNGSSLQDSETEKPLEKKTGSFLQTLKKLFK